jgi:hypothetical protein
VVHSFISACRFHFCHRRLLPLRIIRFAPSKPCGPTSRQIILRYFGSTVTQAENEKLCEGEKELKKALAAAKEDIQGLHADLGRQDNVMQLIEDALPANSDKIKESMRDVLKCLTREQARMKSPLDESRMELQISLAVFCNNLRRHSGPS